MKSRALRLLILALVFAVQIGGEPLHAVFHFLTDTIHADSVATDSGLPRVAEQKADCRFLENWISLIDAPVQKTVSLGVRAFAPFIVSDERRESQTAPSVPDFESFPSRGPPRSASLRG